MVDDLIKDAQERAAVMAVVSVLDAVTASIRLLAQASDLREGPKAKRGARSHQVWRDMLAWSNERMAPVVLALGVSTAAAYSKVAEGAEDG